MYCLAKKRIVELDIAKGFAILGVILVHIPLDWRMFNRGINFHLTVFFMVSGILLWSREDIKLNLWKNVIEKTKSLLYPYFTLSIIYFLFVQCIHLISPSFVFESAFQIAYKTIIGWGIGTLWFLPTLYGATIVSLIAKKMTNGLIGGGWIRRLFIVIFFCMSFLAQYLTSINICGQYYGEMHNLHKNIITLGLKILIASGWMAMGFSVRRFVVLIDEHYGKYGCLALFSLLTIINFMVDEKLGSNDLHFVKIDNATGYILGGFLGSLSIFFLAQGLKEYVLVKKIFGWFGKNSLVIMTTHKEYLIVTLALHIVSLLLSDNLFGKLSLLILIVTIEFLVCSIVKNSFLKIIYNYNYLKIILSKMFVAK